MLCRLVAIETPEELIERELLSMNFENYLTRPPKAEEFFFIIKDRRFLHREAISFNPNEPLRTFYLYAVDLDQPLETEQIIPIDPLILEKIEWNYQGLITATEAEYQSLKTGIPLPKRTNIRLEYAAEALHRLRLRGVESYHSMELLSRIYGHLSQADIEFILYALSEYQLNELYSAQEAQLLEEIYYYFEGLLRS